MQDQQSQRLSATSYGNIVLWVIVGWAMTIYMPVRRGMGKDHIGIEALVGFLWLGAWIGFWHAEPLLPLVLIYLVSIVFHRLNAFVRRQRGEFVHTYYNGEPWLAMKLFGQKDELKAKQFIEPFLSFGLGMFLLQFGEGVGLYFMGGAGALLATYLLIAKRDERAVDAMRNGMFENEALMSHFHKPGRQGRRRF